MNDVNESTSQETEGSLDLDWLTEALGEPAQETTPEEQGGESAGEPPAEGSNESPTERVRELSEQEVDQRLLQRLEALKDQRQAERQQQEFQELLTNGDDAEVGRQLRTMLLDQQNRQTISQEVIGDYGTRIVQSILTEDFVKSLTEDERKAIDPDNVPGGDAEYIAHLVKFREERGRSNLFDEAEVERRVEERLKAGTNGQRAATLRSASPTQVPASSGAAGESWDGKVVEQGSTLDDLFAKAYEEMESGS